MRVLFVDVDSLRPDHLGCYGYDRDTSPTIDALADRGRVFTNYYASDVPCGPSRTALFSGRFGVHTGVVNHGGTNADPRRRGPDRDFHTGFGTPSWPRTLRDAGHRTALISPFPQRHGAFHVTDGFEEWIDTGGDGLERADVVCERATGWLDDHAAEDDWYLHVNVWDPHTPYDTPAEYGDPFEDDPAPAFPDAETIEEQYAGYGPHSAQDVHHGYMTGDGPDDLPRTPDEIASREDFERWIDGYDTGIRYMDDHLERLFDRLRQAGVLEETLIVVSADHGENQGELNVYGDHQTADQMTCRVPLVVAGPGVESGTDEDLHYHVDLPATLNDHLDVTVPEGWDGRSFAPSLADGESAGREFLVLSQGAWACQRAVRWEGFILIRTYHDGLKQFDPVELYDLDADPHETTNLARERAERTREGLALLEEWASARLLESATGENGGQPGAENAVEDPLWRVIREGGPYHTRGNVESYARRLRDTGRQDHADEVESRRGVVSTTPSEYLDG